MLHKTKMHMYYYKEPYMNTEVQGSKVLLLNTKIILGLLKYLEHRSLLLYST